MKTRLGFVSNSSSSSFVVNTKDLTPLQIYAILEYYEVAKKMVSYGIVDIDYVDFGWEINRIDDTIECDTTIDNFELEDFLVKHLGIPVENIYDRWHS